MSKSAPRSAAGRSAPCTDFAAKRRGRPSAAEAERLTDHILDAGWQLLLDGGFETFSFERLARAARTGKPTIYARFGDKRGFLNALLERRTEWRRAAIEKMGQDRPFAEALCRQAGAVLDLLFSEEGILFERLVDWLDQEPGAEGGSTRGQSYARALESIYDMLARAQERGEVQFPDIAEAASFWIEGLIGHARLAMSQGTPSHDDNERWARTYTARFLRAFDSSGAAARIG